MTLFIDILQSQDILKIEDYIEIVDLYHPLVKKANLNVEVGEAYRLQGLGALDPKISSDYQTKDFGGLDYFTIWESELKMPTRLPVDFALGYELNNGQFLNQENTVPNQGLVYGTFNVSLIRGLLFDEQRYQIQNADLKIIKSDLDRVKLRREVIYQSIIAYLEWALARAEVDVLVEFENLINERYEDIVQLYNNGENPAIDTIEAAVNLNSAQKMLLDSQNKLNVKKRKVSLFLWSESEQPLLLRDIVLPDSLSLMRSWLDNLVIDGAPAFRNDEKVLKLQNELSSLRLNNKLLKEQLKPQLNLKYNTILNLGKDNFNPTFAINDYKYGVDFEYSILNRKTKGYIQYNEALSNQIQYDESNLINQLENKYLQLLESKAYQEQISRVIQEKLNNTRQLFQAEQLKFRLGESTVFLTNMRARKLLEANLESLKNLYEIGVILNDLYFFELGQVEVD